MAGSRGRPAARRPLAALAGGVVAGAGIAAALALTGLLPDGGERVATASTDAARTRTTLRRVAPPALNKRYTSVSGATARYPASWQVERQARRGTADLTYFEYADLADAKPAQARAFMRLVFGQKRDWSLYPGLAPLLARARSSAEDALEWKLTFTGRENLSVAGAKVRLRRFAWSVSKGVHGLGFAFAARHAPSQRWVYGWTRYD